jgi:hypothetical protein
MIVNDLATGLMVLLLLLVNGREDVWLIYLVAFLYGTSLTVFFAARSSLLVSMVAEERLGEANGALESLRQGLRVGGPLAGAALFAIWGGGVVAILDSATFFASAGFLLALRVNDLEKADERPPLLEEITAGARHLWREPELRRFVVVLALALCTVGMLEAAFFALVDDGLHRPPAFVGVVGAVQGVGAILGGVSAGRIMRRLGESKLSGLGLAVCGVGLGAIVAGTMVPALAGASLVGVGLSWLLVGYVTLLQRRTDPRLQGRVFSAAEALLAAPQTLSIGLGAALVTVVGFRMIYGLNAIVLLLCGWILFRASWVQHDSDDGPPPDPSHTGTVAVPPVPPEPVIPERVAYESATSSSRSSPQ